MNQITPVVKQLLIVNVILFVGAYFIPYLNEYFPLYFFENPMFKIWQPITHMFMHGGIMHILFNMFALFSFGSVLEQIWGGKKFFIFYVLCGLGAALLHTAVNYWQFHETYNTLTANGFNGDEILNLTAQNSYDNRWLSFVNMQDLAAMQQAYFSRAVGASGAIYGLLVAFAFMFPNAGLALIFVPVPIKAKYFVPAILLYDLFSGFNGSSIFGLGGGVAHFAHVGGAIVGFILMWIWKKNQFNQFRWDQQ